MPADLAFQYVVAEPSQQLLDSITEEEMLAYYEENKDALFRRPVTPIRELPQLPGMMPSGAGSGAFPFPTPGRPVTPTNVPTLPDLPDIEGNKATPAETDLTNLLPGQEDVVPSAPEESTPDTPAPAESEEAEKPAEETSAVLRVLTRFVSYQTDEEETPEPAVPQPEDSEPITNDVVEELPPIIQPRVIIQEEEEKFVMPSGGTPQTTEAGQTTESEPVDLSVLYKPFDEVKDQIREELAMDKAMAGLPGIQEKMREYAAVYHAHFEQNKPIPPMPDLTGFVAEQGLKLVTVPKGNVYAAIQTELARRGSRARQYLVQMFRRMPLMFEGEVFFGSNVPVLYWITEEQQELRPNTLNEVREIVLKRWKEIEARALARKKAEELANEAKTANSSLTEIFAGRSGVTVVDTEPFTWMTYGGLHPITAVMQRVPPVLGEIRERGVVAGNSEFDNQLIVAPGWNFMETVYSLPVGETGVVFNQPQSAVYVVRVTSSSPSEDVLWEQFQTSFVLVYLYAGRPEMMATSFEAWLDEIRNKTGFRWVNKPDARESEWLEEGF
jgi:hypothetical protein